MRRALGVPGGLWALGVFALLVVAAGALWHSARSVDAASMESMQPVPGGFSAGSYTNGGITYRYQIFFPRNYDARRQWPTIVALHGSGEKGSDGVLHVEGGLGKYVRSHAATFPAVVIFPQVPHDLWAPSFYGSLNRLVDSAFRQVNADPKRLYITGFSSGGVIAYNFVHAEPGRYAALVPVGTVVTLMPGGDKRMLPPAEAFAAEAKALGSAPVWIFHGAKDDLVAVSIGRQAAKGLEQAGATVRYTEYPDGGHDVRDEAFANQEFWPWLFSQHR
jgi:predicted peptidase